MKLLILTLLTLNFSHSAFAQSASNGAILLTRSENNGPVNPQDAYTGSCRFSNTTVFISKSNGPTSFPRTLIKLILFTKEVPNATVMQSLILETAHFTTTTGRGPVGGGVTSYEANLTQAKSRLLRQTSENQIIATNIAPATAKLVKFMDSNCK